MSPGESPARRPKAWRRSSLLAAEQGRVPNDRCSGRSRPPTSCYRVPLLADWYQVEDRREQHERHARDLQDDTASIAWSAHQPAPGPGGSSGPLMTQLDPEVARLKVLFEKSRRRRTTPQLQQFYQASRDSDLLSIALADGVVGHPPGLPVRRRDANVLGECATRRPQADRGADREGASERQDSD